MKEDYFNILIKDIIENNDKEKAIETIANKLNEKQLSSEKEILASIKKDQEIERLNNIINEIEEHFVFLKMNSTGGNKEFFEDILDFIKALKELKGSDKK